MYVAQLLQAQTLLYWHHSGGAIGAVTPIKQLHRQAVPPKELHSPFHLCHQRGPVLQQLPIVNWGHFQSSEGSQGQGSGWQTSAQLPLAVAC